MKKKIAILALIFCVASTSTAFARGYYGPHGGGYYGRSDHYGYRGRSYNYGYRDRGYHYGYRDRGYRHYSRGHHDDGLGIALGVMGGLILGSALMYSATPPPRTVVYGAPYTSYQPVVVAPQPRICAEDRRVSGEWQISQFDGRQVWVSYPYPVTRRIQIPCY